MMQVKVSSNQLNSGLPAKHLSVNQLAKQAPTVFEGAPSSEDDDEDFPFTKKVHRGAAAQRPAVSSSN
jgi:hypothetical protein